MHRAARRRRARSSVGVPANTSRTVSLNWRTLEKPAANAMSVIGIAVVSISTRAVWAALRPGERERPAADLGDEQPVELAGAVAEAAGETGDAFAVDDTVGDQSHRPTDDIGPRFHSGEPGAGVGPAALAGPVAVLLRGGRREEELDVVPRLGVIAGHDGRQ